MTSKNRPHHINTHKPTMSISYLSVNKIASSIVNSHSMQIIIMACAPPVVLQLSHIHWTNFDIFVLRSITSSAIFASADSGQFVWALSLYISQTIRTIVVIITLNGGPWQKSLGNKVYTLCELMRRIKAKNLYWRFFRSFLLLYSHF